jgi:hypothetical protein
LVTHNGIAGYFGCTRFIFYTSSIRPAEKTFFSLTSYLMNSSRFCDYCLRFEVMVFWFHTMESLVILDPHASFSILLAFKTCFSLTSYLTNYIWRLYMEWNRHSFTFFISRINPIVPCGHDLCSRFCDYCLRFEVMVF